MGIDWIGRADVRKSDVSCLCMYYFTSMGLFFFLLLLVYCTPFQESMMDTDQYIILDQNNV